MIPAAELFPKKCFHNKRLVPRAVGILEAVMRSPGASIVKAVGSGWQRAYEFFRNGRVERTTMMQPGFERVGREIRDSTAATTLCVQDTTELNLSSHTTMTGLGEIGNPECRGIFLHCALAIGSDATPIGLLGVKTWVRDPAAHGKSKKRGRAYEEKESAKWWETMCAAEEAVGIAGRLLHVSDREADICEYFERAEDRGYRLLVRAAQDRAVQGEHRQLWDAAESWPVVGRRVIHVPHRPARDGKPARPAREAELELRFGSVRFREPDGGPGSLRMNVVFVREPTPPEGQEPVEWMLLTNDPVDSAAQAWQCVEWYRMRWLIEEFHKCLKTGCRVEERQFQTRHNFEVALAFFLQGSVHILAMRGLSRSHPEAPAAAVMTAEEIEVLKAVAADRSIPVDASPSVRQAVHAIARLGGFAGRTGDGEPGWLTLWRGYELLQAIICGYRLANKQRRAPSRHRNDAPRAAKRKRR